MPVNTDVGECLREEGGVYCGGSIPVLDCFAGGGCCVWDSGGVSHLINKALQYNMESMVNGVHTDHPDSKSHLHG